MEVNQILMMPASFGGWQSHDDDIIYLYTRYDSDIYVYILLAPPMSNFDTTNGLWNATDLWPRTRRMHSIGTGHIRMEQIIDYMLLTLQVSNHLNLLYKIEGYAFFQKLSNQNRELKMVVQGIDDHSCCPSLIIHIFFSLDFSATSRTFASIAFFFTLCARSSWWMLSTINVRFAVAKVVIVLISRGTCASGNVVFGVDTGVARLFAGA